MKKFIHSENEMLHFGGMLAKACQAGTVIFLYGNLGAGKTTLCRGFLKELGHQGAVKSPTYTIVEPYEFENMTVYHFDFYRIHDPQELEYIGMTDYFTRHSICLIEWPDQGASSLPSADVSCYIEIGEMDKTERIIQLEAHSARGRNMLKRIVNVQ